MQPKKAGTPARPQSNLGSNLRQNRPVGSAIGPRKAPGAIGEEQKKFEGDVKGAINKVFEGRPSQPGSNRVAAPQNQQ